MLPSSVSTLLADERGAYSEISYSLSIGITILVMSSLLTTTGTFVNNTTDSAAETQLSVIGDRIATQIMAIDQQAVHDDDLRVVIDIDAPKRAAGAYYMIRIQNAPPDGQDYLLLYSVNENAAVKIPLDLSNQVSESTVASDENLVVEREGGVIQIEVID